jgi:glycosyltransferase involved in cell wall biosynthesis
MQSTLLTHEFDQCAEADRPESLSDCRVIGLLNGTEVFGQEKGNIEVFKTIRDLGAEVIVAVNSVGGNHVRSRLEQLGFETVALPFGCQWSKAFVRRHPQLAVTLPLKVIRSSYALGKLIHRFRPTHIHLGNPLAYSYVAPTLACSTVPLVFRVGDEPPLESQFNLRIWKSCFSRAKRVVANSEFVCDSIRRTCPDAQNKLTKIFNFVSSGDDGGNRLWPESERHIVYVGQISEHKGVRHLVDAAERIVRQYDDVFFDVIGGSTYTSGVEQDLKQRIDDLGIAGRVRMHGRVENPAAFFRSATLHVAPSLFEDPAANVVLEAKLAGTPSVVYPSGGLPELVRHQVDGVVCKNKSVEALESALVYCLDHSLWLDAACERSVDDHQQRFNHNRFAQQWAVVYRTCMGGDI